MMRSLRIVLACVAALFAVRAVGADNRSAIAERFVKITRDSPWKPVRSIPVRFPTFHPQGMVKIGDDYYVSSVEVRTPTKRFPRPIDGYDRDAGAGVGHLFKIDGGGNLVADLKLGDGTLYHPGGIDYDGKRIWVPVAEYRPNSRAIVYSVDPRTMRADEVLRFADHIGAIVRNTDDNTLHGVSWGSRRFYQWGLDRKGRVKNAAARPVLNSSHYVDYQDCKYVGGRQMLCSGVTEIRQNADAPPFRLGGLDLVDLRDARPRHQVPLLLWTERGMDMTHNPVWLEAAPVGLRGYFMPEDNTSIIYVFEVESSS